MQSFSEKKQKTIALYILKTIVCIFSKLKVVPATFLLICFVCLKESTCETRKNAFSFTSKALFVPQIIKFQIFRYSNVMTSSNA